MSRSFEYRASFAQPAERVHSAMVDRSVLEKRLTELGGPDAAVQDHETSAGGVSYTLRHGIPDEEMPEMVVKLLPGGKVVVKRTESWSASPAGGYTGKGQVAIAGTPAKATATMHLRDAGGGSELGYDVEVTVKVPIIGSKVEETVAEQIHNLLSAESEFLRGQITG